MTADAVAVQAVDGPWRPRAEVATADPGPDPLVDRISERLLRTGTAPTPAAVAAAVRAEGAVVGDQTLLDLVTMVRRDLRGAGPLQDLLGDPTVTDVLVNAPDQVYVDRGAGLQLVPIRFRDEAAVRRLAQRLAAGAGRRLDVAQPTVDARLDDGARLHVVLPPVSPAGTLISLRVGRRRAFSLADLEERRTVAPVVGELLRSLVLARLSFLVTGGTGSGKTTLLATLLGEVPPGERIVLVEDSGELRPAHPHVVRLEARLANVEGQGAIGLRTLVRQALRMRPDRIVVGEVRGGEVVDLLAALNTGHDGGCGTVHASTAESLPARLEALALAAGMGREALHSQLSAGVAAVVHLDRDGRGGRRVGSIGCLARRSDGLVTVIPALRVDSTGHVTEGAGAGALGDLLSRGDHDRSTPARPPAPVPT